jgi:hypothetical protein
MELDHRVSLCSPLEEGRLNLEFTDGACGTVDLHPHIQAGGAFAALADPAVFATVHITRGGRSLAWPCGVDLCADALWMEALGLDPQADLGPNRQAS